MGDIANSSHPDNLFNEFALLNWLRSRLMKRSDAPNGSPFNPFLISVFSESRFHFCGRFSSGKYAFRCADAFRLEDLEPPKGRFPNSLLFLYQFGCVKC